MVFIGAHWWLWLVLVVIFGGYVAYNHHNNLKRIQGMAKKGFDQNNMDVNGLVISCVLCGIATGLLLFSILINLIAFAR